MFTTAPPPEAQLAAAKRLIDNYRLAMGQSYPVVGHRDIGDSSCPGATWSQWRHRLSEAAPDTTDWRAEAERYRQKAEQATAEVAQLKTKLEIEENAMRTAARTLLAYVTLNK